VPSVFLFLAGLPLTPNGKVDRQALPDPVEYRSEPSTFVAPRTFVEQQLTEEWEKFFDLRPIGIRDNFFDLGGHSLLGVRLVAGIEKRLGKTVLPAVLFQFPTIEQLAHLLEQETWPQSWSSLLPVQSRGSRCPFFWVHGDSSNVVLSRYLGPDQPLYGLEHQSQDGKPALYTRVETIAAHYLNQVRTVCARGPYFLGGYSFGAVVAFEMAHQLRKQGEKVAFLFLLDPLLEAKAEPPSSRREGIRRHFHNLWLLGSGDLLSYLSLRVTARIQERTRRIGKTFKRLRWKVYLALGRLLPSSLRSAYILDVYTNALLDYSPQPYPGRVTLFKGARRYYHPRFDWRKLIGAGLEIHEGSGAHMDMVKEPYAALWAERLKECLQRENGKPPE
jgi:thioesterase domain-containing protein/acyl carrier protein